MKTIIIDKVNHHIKSLPDDTALCIGNFDGVHLGHQELFKCARLLCKNVAVMTFEPHPEVLIKKIDDIKLLTPLEEKKEVLNNLNIDYLIIVKFDSDLMKMEKNDFISFLSKFKFKEIICGYDFRFGYMGLGNADDLKNSFLAHVVAKYEIRSKRVSSSYIRELLTIGDVEGAKEMLGREYHIRGEVVHGNKMGSKIGFPTANVDYKDYYLPQTGVYIAKIIHNNNEYYGMVNIGHNPTFNPQENIRLEANIFEFDKEIYGDIIDIYFLERVRPEKQFISVSELVDELTRNQAYGIKKYLKKDLH